MKIYLILPVNSPKIQLKKDELHIFYEDGTKPDDHCLMYFCPLFKTLMQILQNFFFFFLL